ncbi:putative protein K02A2.6, partial [Mucuna pruriens]
MRLARELGAKVLVAKSDSQLVTRQVNGDYQVKDPEVVASFEKFITQKGSFNRTVIQETLGWPTIEAVEVFCADKSSTWMDLIIIPTNQHEAKRFWREASRYVLIAKQLYRRGFSYPLLKCLDDEEEKYAIKEVHEGSCGMHIEGWALTSKITRVDYYSPTLKNDYMAFVRKCDKCQRYANLHIAPFGATSFDILDPFPQVVGQVKFLLVVVDYFTRWVEAGAIVTISTKRIRRFYWKKIICRFRLPTIIISDNGTQFASHSVVDFCAQYGVKQSFTYVEYPQVNGQEESINKGVTSSTLVVPHYTHSTTQETPFRLRFETNVVVLVKIEESSPRAILFQPTIDESYFIHLTRT